MMHLRVISPPDLTDTIVKQLEDDPGTADIVLHRGAAVSPPGDVIICDVVRESASPLVEQLEKTGLAERGAIALDDVAVTLSAAADRAELLVPGDGSESVIWEQLERRSGEETHLSPTFLVFISVAAMIAALGILLDQPILIVGAMVVGPEFGPLAALAVGGLLAYGFGVWRYWHLYRARPRPLPLAILVALVLLTEAMFAVAFARNWQTTWWEWHLLMLVAVGVVALAARREWRLEGSSAEIFSDIYEEQTRGHLEEVSVLFADLQGYTAFSERTPEPEIKAMLDTYFPAAAPVLQAHGGELYNTIGDAIMVVFRGPGHELRAGRTGLEFQREMTRIADAHPGWPRFRAGVNSGEALLGVVDAPGKRGYTATGDTVNLASRLEGQARAGEVVGFAGLAGAGRTELVEAVFGAQPADGGEVYLEGARVGALSPARATGSGGWNWFLS